MCVCVVMCVHMGACVHVPCMAFVFVGVAKHSGVGCVVMHPASS